MVGNQPTNTICLTMDHSLSMPTPFTDLKALIVRMISIKAHVSFVARLHPVFSVCI